MSPHEIALVAAGLTLGLLLALHHNQGRLRMPRGSMLEMSEEFTQSFDARDWARAFVEYVRINPAIATDEGTMITWFANALMRGYDHARQGRDPAQLKPRSPVIEPAPREYPEEELRRRGGAAANPLDHPVAKVAFAREMTRKALERAGPNMPNNSRLADAVRHLGVAVSQLIDLANAVPEPGMDDAKLREELLDKAEQRLKDARMDYRRAVSAEDVSQRLELAISGLECLLKVERTR